MYFNAINNVLFNVIQHKCDAYLHLLVNSFDDAICTQSIKKENTKVHEGV